MARSPMARDYRPPTVTKPIAPASVRSDVGIGRARRFRVCSCRSWHLLRFADDLHWDLSGIGESRLNLPYLLRRRSCCCLRHVANDSLSTFGNRDVLDGDFLIGPAVISIECF